MPIRHGMSKTSEFVTWSSIKSRCHNPNAGNYRNYGARGIAVCDRWRNSFDAFLSDMGRKPSPEHSIERINNDGPYAPDNCRWANKIDQHRNTRRTRLLTVNGETRSAAEWCERYGLPKTTLSSRLAMGWSVERAVTEPQTDKAEHCSQKNQGNQWWRLRKTGEPNAVA